MKNLSPPVPSRQTRPRPARSLAALGLLLVAAGAAQAQTPASFAPVSTYATGAGSTPYGVTLADLNRDGRLDIVTANQGSSTAGVLLGQAGGGFSAVSTYSAGAGSRPVGVALADVSGDGWPDIITANNGSSTAGVLLGQAGGSFVPVITYSVGFASSAYSVAVADVNGDGRRDIVTANIGSNTAGVLLGQAGGGFTPASTYPTGANSFPNGLAVADVSGDGRPDLVTANYSSSTVGVLLGQAGGGFATVMTYSTDTGSTPVGVVLADVSGDGRADIITANQGTNTVGVLLGQVGGGFTAVTTYSTGAGSFPKSVAVSDVNGDGRADIITANYNGTAGVLLRQTGGSFGPISTYSTGPNSSPRSVIVADVSGDGRPDIVTANFGSSTAGVLLNTGTFTPLAVAPTATPADMVLFPNPAHNGFTVQLPAAWGTAPVRAELRNALGQVVGTRTAAAGGAALNFATGGLAAGVYMLRVQAGGHTVVKRVVLD